MNPHADSITLARPLDAHRPPATCPPPAHSRCPRPAPQPASPAQEDVVPQTRTWQLLLGMLALLCSGIDL